MRWIALLVGTLAWLRAASATPIEPLWETRAHCDRAPLFDWHDSLAWLDRGRVMRVDRATGKLARSLELAQRITKGRLERWADYARLEAILGDDLLVQEGHFFVLVDGATGKVRWRRDQLETDGGLPYLASADGDVLWVHPTSFGADTPPVFVERIERATGNTLWRGDTEKGSGQIDWIGTDAVRIYVATSPDAIGHDEFVAAFDLASGKRLWSQHLVSTSVRATGFVLGDDKLFFAMAGEGLRVIDGGSGKLVAKVPLSNIDRGVRAIVLDGERAYVNTGDALIQIDLANRAVLWTIQEELAEVIAARGALYAEAGEEMHALDPADGHVLATYGIAGMRLLPSSAAAGAPAFVVCDGERRLRAFDPTGTVLPPEHAVISGKLECASCGAKQRAFPPLRVSIGNATAMTDVRGAFRIEVEGRGALTLSFDLPNVAGPISWAGDTSRIIQFGGHHRYPLGVLRVHKDCGPLEGC